MVRLTFVLGIAVVVLLGACTPAPAATPTPTLTPSPTRTPTPTATASPTPSSGPSIRFYGLDGQGPGAGIYTYIKVDTVTTAISGRVFVDGLPIPNWPGTEWPSDYPPLRSGEVLVVFMPSVSVESYLYTKPGLVWTKVNPIANPAFGGVDIYVYVPGYVIVKFGNVPVEDGKTTVLPDVTLGTKGGRWVFYTEEHAKMYQ